MNKTLIKAITFIAGTFFLLEFVLPEKFPAWLGGIDNPLSGQLTNITLALTVLAGMAAYLGPFNLTRSEIMKVVKSSKGWGESVVFLIMMVLGIIAASGRYRDGLPAQEEIVMYRFVTTRIFNALFYGIQTAFYISSMGLITFYLVSAAHRAFLLNNMESTLMMVAATIVILGLTPFGDYISRLMPEGYGMASIGNWIRNVPNSGVQRAVVFGICGGAFTAAVRNWLSLGKGATQ